MARKQSVIRKKRLELDITQSELADMLNVSRASVNSWENKSTVPTVHNMVILSVHLDLTLDELMNDYSNKESEE